MFSANSPPDLVFYQHNSMFSGKITFPNFLFIELILLDAESAFPQGLLFLPKTRPLDFWTCPFSQKAVLSPFWIHISFERPSCIPAGAFFRGKNDIPRNFEHAPFFKKAFWGHYKLLAAKLHSRRGFFSAQKMAFPGILDMPLFPKGRFR